VDLPDRIAALAGERVLVAGSLPSPDSDLDLLVRPPAATAIGAGLEAEGFEGRSGVWVRFETREVVDLTDAADWRLPPAEVSDLFERAEPIEPAGIVCRPAPDHVVLILARRAMREGPRLKPARAARLSDELVRDPEAFAGARARAAAWGATAAVEALERAHRHGSAIGVDARRAAIEEELRGSRSRLGAAIGAWRAILRRPRWGSLVVVAGGPAEMREHQATELEQLLDKIGFDVERLGAGEGAPDRPALLRALLAGKVVVLDAPAAPRWPRPVLAEELDPQADPERRRVALGRAAWAALSG
jgi:hypothetical protein